MTRKARRLYVIIAALVTLGLAAGVSLYALNDQIVFFVTPSELADRPVKDGEPFRLGGLVAPGSIVKDKDGLTTHFVVTDGNANIKVSYTGMLPDLFRDGQGAVADGTRLADGSFKAERVLAKHDENYMPKEVADRLKKEGHWMGGKKDGAT